MKKDNRTKLILLIMILISIIYSVKLFKIQVLNNEKYIELAKKQSEKIINGTTAPRGRIYDRNGRLIVDNQAKKVIYYKKNDNVSTSDEIKLAYKINKYINIDISNINKNIIKNFYIIKNKEETNKLITDEELEQFKLRKITESDLKKIKNNRITDEMLSTLTEEDLKAAYIYYLMNNGYYYDEKIIKEDNVTDEEYALVAENLSELNGFNTKLSWERVYLYDDTFKSILGKVSTIPSEQKDKYLNKGYELNDLVGISYLEYMYDDYLKGEKNTYIINNKGKHILKEGNRGNDIYLTIDINLQQDVENILAEEILKTKNEPNTEYFNKAFVIISNPNTGEILAMAGKIYRDGKIFDYTPGIITTSVVPGSIVKGASQIVGYNTGALHIDEYRDDACIKIKSTPMKCSWQYLGYINDITALALSSNTYQFNTAINVGGGYYYYDGPLTLNPEAYNIYRNIFKQFGLGQLTGIDLPNEKLGFKGNNTSAAHILDFAIGQYDTYTPIELSQYINTIANNGNRVKPYLLKEIHSSKNGDIILKSQTEILNTVETSPEYMDRVKTGLKAVVDWGTGYGFVDPSIMAAGKTGTSQSFIDTNNDGVIDKETISTAFLAYAPYYAPEVSFTILTPDISHYEGLFEYQSNLNSRISYEVSKKYFDFYK